MSSPTIKASLWAPADQRQQHKGRARPDQDGMGRIVFERPGQRRRGGHDHGDAGDLQQPQQDEVGQDLVARSLVEQAVDAQEGRPVGRLGARPHRVGHLVERRRPEHLGPVGVGVDVVAHHLALRGVGVDVAAEERRCEEQRDGPDRHDEHDTLDREAVVAVEVAEEAEPHPAEEDEPTEDERERRDGRERAVRAERTEGSARHAEEPGAGEVGLEGLAAEHGSNDDCRAARASPSRAVRATLSCTRRLPRRVGVDAPGCGVAVVVALGDTSSIGDSLR